MRVIAVLAFLVIVSGCSAIPGYTQVEGAFVIGTDKTMTDHVISISSGKNCSTVRKEKGLTYCEEDEPKIKQNIFCYLRELMHFDNFSIHILDKKNNKLELVLSSGLPEEVQNIDLYALPDGNGITGYVAYHGRSYICPNVEGDSRYFKGLEGALSSLTVPLRLNDEVIGVLNVESNLRAAFDEESRQLAEIFGRDIATAPKFARVPGCAIILGRSRHGRFWRCQS